MVRTSFDGRTIAKVLRQHGFKLFSRTGSHLKLRLDVPNSDEIRNVTVPMKPADEISQGTMHSIAEQAGANDFQEFCTWIEDNS